MRITAKEDLTKKETKRAIHSLIRFCGLHDVEVHTWVSIPCMAGCRLRSLNNAMGIHTGDDTLTDQLIDAAIQICMHADRTGITSPWTSLSRPLQLA